MKTVMIVENNRLEAEALNYILQKAGYGVLAMCASGTDAINILKENVPDVVLMDISLDGVIDGISTGKIIKRNHGIPIIYLTLYSDDEIFFNAQETSPSGYLSKPYNDLDIYRAIEIATGNAITVPAINSDSLYSKVEDGVFIYTHSGEYEKLCYTDILYIEAQSAYSHIYYKKPGEKRKSYYNVSMSSNHVAEKLNYKKLIRINRSIVVNIDKIDKIRGAEIFIEDFSVAISKEYKDDILTNKIIRIKK